MRWIVLLAGLLGAVGVAIGAHAAHGLEAMLLQQGVVGEQVAKRLSQCEVASRYHMLHCLALLSLGLVAEGLGTKRRTAAASFFLLGIILFSGGLYSMVYLGQMGHWAIVPSGGLCFILGWLFTASLAWKRSATT
ncbi:MAG: DUF423 domain-containing protein [Planctomycetales bacterium]|nr:DUF423 domain-containing protein [Planctomycetales bacterium]